MNIIYTLYVFCKILIIIWGFKLSVTCPPLTIYIFIFWGVPRIHIVYPIPKLLLPPFLHFLRLDRPCSSCTSRQCYTVTWLHLTPVHTCERPDDDNNNDEWWVPANKNNAYNDRTPFVVENTFFLFDHQSTQLRHIHTRLYMSFFCLILISPHPSLRLEFEAARMRRNYLPYILFVSASILFHLILPFPSPGWNDTGGGAAGTHREANLALSRL